MSWWVRIFCGLLGLAIQIMVFDAAIRTFLLPRVASVRFTRTMARGVRLLFRPFTTARRSYRAKDQILSLYAPILLLSFQAVWSGLTVVAFALGFVAFGVSSFAHAFEVSGSSLFTLGSVAARGGGQTALSFVEAAINFTLLALLIAFVPTLYAAFQRRELAVSRLSVQSGVPATPWGVIEIAQSIKSYDRLDELWREWEQWFIELGETHTTLTILNFYRSPNPQQTWIGAAATVLDSAALYNAAVDLPPSASAGLCIRSGWISLRRMADYFHIAYDANPDRSMPITITRHEFDLALDHLERSGVPVIADRDTAWGDFVGWRVNYDTIIEASYVLFTCPRTDWESAQSQPLFGDSNVRGKEKIPRSELS